MRPLPTALAVFLSAATLATPTHALFLNAQLPKCSSPDDGLIGGLLGDLRGQEECRCNTMDPECGLSFSEAQGAYLTPNEELATKLQAIVDSFAFSETSAQAVWGPLVKNGDNGGLIDIDVPLLDTCDPERVNCTICGVGTSPTVREATVCSVENDPLGFTERGNKDLAKIGFSTQGRELLAIRMGNFETGTRVLGISQVHGTEPASTEAFLTVLASIADGTHPEAASLLENLDMLMILRANPDGGDPFGHNLEEDFVDYYTRAKNYTDSSYFFRQNVDPLAGGGFGAADGNPQSEPDFFGIVGRGYNLNRYNYAAFDYAIRPVENQAFVSVIHTFQPRVLHDAHGDAPKAVCKLNLLSLQLEAVLNVLPSLECLPFAPKVPTMANGRPYMVEASIFADNGFNLTTEEDMAQIRSLAEYVFDQMDGTLVGHVQRFSQIQLGGAAFSTGSLGDAVELIGGLASGMEVNNFDPSFRPGIFSYNLDADTGTYSPGISIDAGQIDPCFLPDNICIHEAGLTALLMGVVQVVDKPATMPSDFCDAAIKHNLPGTFPSRYGWGEFSLDELTLVPSAGQFGIPTSITGECPGDAD